MTKTAYPDQVAPAEKPEVKAAAVSNDYKSPLHQMTQTTQTCLWNDSASIQELTYSIEHGAVGATCNPVIVVGVLKKEMSLWRDRIRSLIDEMPVATEDQIGWQIVGRLDDWLKLVAEKENITIDPGYLEWAGVAVFKKAYQIFRERGYRVRLLSAAFRNHMHWSEFIGGDVVISPPYSWQLRYNASDIEVHPRIDKPVEPRIVEELSRKFVDFRRAYIGDGLSIEEFDSFGATRRTLRQFIAGCYDLNGIVRDFILPNPDAD